MYTCIYVYVRTYIYRGAWSSAPCHLLQHAAIHYTTLQHTATYCNIHTSTDICLLHKIERDCQSYTTHRNTPQHTTTQHVHKWSRLSESSLYIHIHIYIHTHIYVYIHINIYIYVCVYINMMIQMERDRQMSATHTATHCNTPQQATSHRNTPQHTHQWSRLSGS